MNVRKLIFDTLYLLGGLKLFSLKKGTVTILCFHRVSPTESKGYPPLKPEVFEGIIRELSKRVEFIDFSEISSNSKKKPCVIITFDDAFKDFEEYALPVLEKYKVPVTLNVIASCAETGLPHWTQKLNCLVEAFANKNQQPKLDGIELKQLELNVNEETVSLEIYNHLKDKHIEDVLTILDNWKCELDETDEIYTKMLTWIDLTSIIKRNKNVYIGNHTYNHLNLKHIIDLNELNKEICAAREKIEKELNCNIDRFAFPNGEYNETSLSIVEQDNNDFIQLTEIKQTPNSEKTFYRIEPYFSSLSENLFKIHGFHEKFKRK